MFEPLNPAQNRTQTSKGWTVVLVLSTSMESDMYNLQERRTCITFKKGPTNPTKDSPKINNPSQLEPQPRSLAKPCKPYKPQITQAAYNPHKPSSPPEVDSIRGIWGPY